MSGEFLSPMLVVKTEPLGERTPTPGGRSSAAATPAATRQTTDTHAALRMGLVQEVVPHDALLRVADEWCDRVSALPPHAMEMTKPLLRAVADASWDGALALEEFAEPSCFTTEAFAGVVRSMLAR